MATIVPPPSPKTPGHARSSTTRTIYGSVRAYVLEAAFRGGSLGSEEAAQRGHPPLNCIQFGQRCVVKGIVSFMSMPHTTQAGSPKQVVELHDASTVSTDPVRVTVMGQHNMRLLEEARFGACIQLDAPMCSEYHGVLSLMVGPKHTMSLQLLPNDEKLELPTPKVCFFGEATSRYTSYLIKVTKRTWNVLTGVDPITLERSSSIICPYRQAEV
eukprot:4985527-Amphidinium_carterae.1